MIWLTTAILTFVLTGAIVLVEMVAPIERFSLKSRIPGFTYGLIGAVGGPVLSAFFMQAYGLLGIKPIIFIPMATMVDGVTAIILTLAITDFMSYWNHRFQHRFLWRIHCLHHSATELNVTNSYAHVSERMFRFALLALPLSLVNIEYAAVPLALNMFRELLERYIHSPTTAHMGPLVKVFVDNRFHRIHHSLEERHFDKNFGILFSFWDRLFGTAYEPGKEWPDTGVAGTPPPQGIVDFFLFPVWRPKASRVSNTQSEAATIL